MELFNQIADVFYDIMLILLIPVSIWIWTPHFNRIENKSRNIAIVLIFYNLMMLADILVGNFWWALMWCIAIMLWINVSRIHKKQKIELDELKEKANSMLIDHVASLYSLDPSDFKIVEVSYDEAELHYKGKLFDASEHIKGDEEETEDDS